MSNEEARATFESLTQEISDHCKRAQEHIDKDEIELAQQCMDKALRAHARRRVFKPLSPFVVIKSTVP